MLKKMMEEWPKCSQEKAQNKKVTRIVKWGKAGWEPSAPKNIGYQSVERRFVRHEEFENEYANMPSEVSALKEVDEQIQIGNPGDASDQLPDRLRIMIEDSDTVIYNNNAFRIKDQVIQALDGNWGADSACADPSNAETVVQKALVAVEALGFDVSAEELNSFISNPHNNSGEITLFEEDDKEAIERVRVKYADLIEGKENDELMQLLVAQEMDMAASHHITTSLNSVYCGDGYRAPKVEWTYQDLTRHNKASVAKLEREELFYSLFSEAGTLSSMNDLYGPVNPETKKPEGGFFGEIRAMYEHDKNLITEWSDEKRIEAAAEKEKELSDKGWSEKEVKKKLKRLFFNTAEQIPAQYDQQGQLMSPGFKVYMCKWDRDRIDALCELNLTKKQWNGIYSLLNIVKFKLLKNRRPDENHIRATSLLMKHFNRVKSLEDLRAYQAWAQKRTFIKKDGQPTYDFKPCVLDHVSMNWTNRWNKMVNIRRNELLLQLNIHNKVNRAIVSTKETDTWMSKSCPYPGCSCTVAGNVLEATLEDESVVRVLKCEHNVIPAKPTKIGTSVVNMKLDNKVVFSETKEPIFEDSVKVGELEYGCDKYFVV